MPPSAQESSVATGDLSASNIDIVLRGLVAYNIIKEGETGMVNAPYVIFVSMNVKTLDSPYSASSPFDKFNRLLNLARINATTLIHEAVVARPMEGEGTSIRQLRRQFKNPKVGLSISLIARWLLKPKSQGCVLKLVAIDAWVRIGSRSMTMT